MLHRYYEFYELAVYSSVTHIIWPIKNLAKLIVAYFVLLFKLSTV